MFIEFFSPIFGIFAPLTQKQFCGMAPFLRVKLEREREREREREMFSELRILRLLAVA